MKNVMLAMSIATIIFSSVSSMAENKVVVVPLGTSAQKPMLACVTGYYGQGEPSNGQIKTSNSNINVDSASDFFHTWQSASQFEDDIRWGLRCNDGWVNTGCSGTNTGPTKAYDLPQYENGCHSDDDEYYSLIIFTTCCKIVY